MPTDELDRILAIDVGAGTQDILIYESSRTPENCFKLVLPSQTQIIASRIREATRHRLPLHLHGRVMGGGASSEAIADHLEAGFQVTATADAAATIHNDLEQVRTMGVAIGADPISGSVHIRLGDVDCQALAGALDSFGVAMPETMGIAVQDHGYRPGSGNNTVRFEYLQSLLDDGGDLASMVFRQAPAGMNRMSAVLDEFPGASVMDTGAAAVLGALGDPAVASAAQTDGAILVNVGNMHTFATLIKRRRLYGLFEHHTGGITSQIIHTLVSRLQRGDLDAESFAAGFDGHGAAIHPAYRNEGPFQFVAVTGPNRAIAGPLGYHQAAPHGDMMLTGSFGLVEGLLMTRGGKELQRLSLIPGSN
ncbi:DUF1786 domain-containing protein [soil metagenome]